MAFTQIADTIEPEQFARYIIERTAQLSRLVSSGIMTSVPGITIPNGGRTINLPFWQDINGDDEVFTDSGASVPDKINADKDIAAILTRIKSWSAHDLSALFSGDDPMGAVVDLAGEFWARKQQKTLLAILQGVFASATMSGNLLDASTLPVSNEMLIDAISLLGDAGGGLTGILTHSAVMYDLAKKRLLDQKITEPGTNTAPEFQTYLGRQIVVDDGAPKTGTGTATVYTTYFFGPGAIAYAEGSPAHPTELGRVELESKDVFINRREFIMHPRGVRWIGNSAAATPSNAELGTGTNWQRVFENKNIRIVALKHKIGA